MSKRFPSKAEHIQKLRIDIEVSWIEVEVSTLKRLDDLKSTLHRWTDYTDNMKDLMTWLRICEEKTKQPFHQYNADELKVKLQELQVNYQFNSRMIFYLSYRLLVCTLLIRIPIQIM